MPNNKRIRKLSIIAMLSAIASILMLIGIPLPFWLPDFLHLDFSCLPALLASFCFGPIPGVIVCLIKNLVYMTLTGAFGAYMGVLSDFLICCCFVVPAGLIYQKKHTQTGALMASAVGLALMCGLGLVLNLYVLCPMYVRLAFDGSEENLFRLYNVLIPGTDTMMKCVLRFHLPLTFVKGFLNVMLSSILYKPLSDYIEQEETAG